MKGQKAWKSYKRLTTVLTSNSEIDVKTDRRLWKMISERNGLVCV